MKAEIVYEITDCTVSIEGRTIMRAPDFRVFSGDFVTISGRSGSGKSTMIQVLLGFLPVAQGSFFYRGNDSISLKAGSLRRDAAVVFQEPLLFGETVRDAVYEPFSYKANSGKRPEEEVVENWLHKLDLKISLDNTLSGISGGEKQRLALLRALLLEREILLLDEVTSALDETHRALVFDIVQAAGKTVIAVSHDPLWIERSPVKVNFTDMVIIEGR